MVRKRELHGANPALGFAVGVALLAGGWAHGVDLNARVYPTLGASEARKVEVAWNRFHDTAGLAGILESLHAAFPDLTRLSSIGKSVEGRDLWCLEVTALGVGNPDRKPGIYIDGNIHGNEVQAGEVVAYTAWYLCHQYDRLDAVTDLLDHCVFYLVPTINPDGRDHWLQNAQSPHSSRSGARPTDNDRDGLMDEDDYDDLDGNGSITMMRIADPSGRWKPHPDYPEYLMVPARDDEPGSYDLLGWEGVDNDGDGQVNEDGIGGYDANRNWSFDWQPEYVQNGAMDYPFSLPETRAVAEFAYAHPNVAASQSYHNAAGMILRGPGRRGGEMQPEDAEVLRTIGARGEKILPFYRSIVVWEGLYTVWGSEQDWFYGARGAMSYTNELWTLSNLNRSEKAPSTEEQAEFLKYVLMGDGVVEWTEFDHPTYGKIEIGGTRKEWSRTPPSFLIEEEAHRNMAFTLYHADMMPRLAIREIEVEPLAGGLHRIWVTVENQRLMPSRSAQDVAHCIAPPDVVSLSGKGLNVLTSGRVTDRFFKRVEAVRRRPERVQLEAIGGMSAERVQFIVSGSGAFTVTVDSAKGGLLTQTGTLP